MRLRFGNGLPALLVLASAAGCTTGGATTSVTPAPAAAAPAAHDAHAKHWGYVPGPDTAGPAEWGSLPGDGACAASSRRQSPIALVSKGPAPNAVATDLPNLVFHYGKTGLHLVNNGHTVQANVDPGSTLEVGGASFTLLQFHLHAPSEHSLEGLQYPMEMHLVHAGPDGKPALVVALLLVQGGDNPPLAPYFAALPKERNGKSDRPDVAMDLGAMLPPDRTYFAYDGSLTTPPCTEGIRWVVLSALGGVSGEQSGAFVSLKDMTPTNRPLQPLSGRAIQIDSTP